MTKRTFHVVLVKPVRYDDDGYPIQWRRIVYPHFALTLLNGLIEDCGARQVLGPDVAITTEAHDDQCGIPPVAEMIGRIRSASAGGMLMIVGAHTAQFPRGADIARQFRAAGIPAIIGGSHVSGCMTTLPEPTPELRDMLDLGVSLFVGEAEERLDEVVRDAFAGTMKPIYNHAGASANMATALLPHRVPQTVRDKLLLGVDPMNPLEAGRGCPFLCSFCTVINVHGRRPRSRTADAVADFVRMSVAGRNTRFLFTDDNFARNENWRAILEKLIELKEVEGVRFSFVIQVDTQSDRDPDFIPMAARAGCVQVFVGMESINPEALKSVAKKQNSVSRYRRFFSEWKRHGIVVMCGYIIGFSTDTPETVRRDVDIIKRELPIDLLYTFILTPLPGSDDHSALVKKGVPLDPDLARYTTFHATTAHPHMSGPELEALYRETWGLYYTDEHCERVMARHLACGGNLDDLTPFQLVARNAFAVENINPAEYGIIRMKRRRERRHGLPRPAWLPFAIGRAWSITVAQARWVLDAIRLMRMARRATRRHAERALADPAMLVETESPETGSAPQRLAG